jgi:hypothetical protein
MGYTCSKCGHEKPRRDFHETTQGDRKRPVKAACKSCRSEGDYFGRRYKTRCRTCHRFRALNKNGNCVRCNEAQMVRQCNGPCGELLPVLLGFCGRKRTCKHCLAVRRAGARQR